jgi:hypothetical protein
VPRKGRTPLARTTFGTRFGSGPTPISMQNSEKELEMSDSLILVLAVVGVLALLFGSMTQFMKGLQD